MQALQVHIEQIQPASSSPPAKSKEVDSKVQGENSFSELVKKAQEVESSSKTEEKAEDNSTVTEKEISDNKTIPNSNQETKSIDSAEKIAVISTQSGTDAEKVKDQDFSQEILPEKNQNLLELEKQGKETQGLSKKKDLPTENLVTQKKLESTNEITETKTEKEKIDSDSKDEKKEMSVDVSVLNQIVSNSEIVSQQKNNEFIKESDQLSINKVGKKDNKDKPVIEVTDLRTNSVEQSVEQKNNFVTSVSFDDQGNAEMTLDLPQGQIQGENQFIINNNGTVQQHTVSNEAQFGQMLSAEIQSNSGELVKTGSIILKDNNQGTINLILHPEQLGNVKIQLEISENIVSGKIIVTSQEAYNAFKENIVSLREAFVANGFENAGFDLSWTGSGTGSDSGFGSQDNQKQNGSTYVNPYGYRYDESVAEMSEIEYADNITGINVMA